MSDTVLLIAALCFLAITLAVTLRFYRQSMVLSAASGVLISSLAALGYSQLGALPKWHEYLNQQQHQAWMQDHIQFYRQHPEQLVERLKSKLTQEPNSVRGWKLLGMVYMSQQKPDLAYQAFRRGYSIDQTDSSLAVRMAEADAGRHDGDWQPEDVELLQKLASNDPSNVMLTHILGIIHYQQSNYTQAISYWRQTLRYLPKESEATSSVISAIAKAEQQLGNAATDSRELKVDVDVATAIRAHYPADTTVIIYAKAVTGPPMPLAVRKCRLADLPLRITLSDQDAMLPNLTISHFKSLRVFARVSVHGQAITEAGDAIGTAAVSAQDAVASITINHFVLKDSQHNMQS